MTIGGLFCFEWLACVACGQGVPYTQFRPTMITRPSIELAFYLAHDQVVVHSYDTYQRSNVCVCVDVLAPGKPNGLGVEVKFGLMVLIHFQHTSLPIVFISSSLSLARLLALPQSGYFCDSLDPTECRNVS